MYFRMHNKVLRITPKIIFKIASTKLLLRRFIARKKIHKEVHRKKFIRCIKLVISYNRFSSWALTKYKEVSERFSIQYSSIENLKFKNNEKTEQEVLNFNKYFFKGK